MILNEWYLDWNCKTEDNQSQLKSSTSKISLVINGGKMAYKVHFQIKEHREIIKYVHHSDMAMVFALEGTEQLLEKMKDISYTGSLFVRILGSG